MDMTDFYGKYWSLTNRQWRNLGLRFKNIDKGVLDNKFVADCLLEGGDTVGYLMLYIQVTYLKRELHKGNRILCSMLMPEIIYDMFTLRSVNIRKYVIDNNGKLKKKVAINPTAHLQNCINRWLKQLMCELYPKKHKYYGSHIRAHNMYTNTFYLDPVDLNNQLDSNGQIYASDYVVFYED